MKPRMEVIQESRSFGGVQGIYRHHASSTKCSMRFAVYVPPQAIHTRVPVLYWLSGLTCTEENFITKAGAQRMAAELGLAIIAPDTSPRGENIPDEAGRYDFGIGAGFYLDAVMQPWSEHYRMYTYITDELFSLVDANFPVVSQSAGIFGHSMGGHGALTIAVKNPHQFRSVSAFAPICSAMRGPWGRYALSRYLGTDEDAWKEYDAASLIASRGWKHSPLLIDQGTEDPYLTSQLYPEFLQQACERADVTLQLRMQKGYDHSYYFISSFIDDHLKFHAKYLLLR